MKRTLLIILLTMGAVYSRAESVNIYQAYSGTSVAGVDTKTLTGKVMCGYQGWFNCAGDGAGLDWIHWGRHGRNMPGPGNITIDLWPDVSEYDDDELYNTAFRYDDGSVAKVFSSYNRKTVLRHFEWMRDYGIDGAFIQRFVNGLPRADHKNHKNTVLAHAREGANLNGRTYAVMYDLSGLRKGGFNVVIDDWKELRNNAHITEDPAYLHHEGKPVVSVWGIGFADRTGYTLEDCRKIIEFLKADGCTVMLGVPPTWLGQGYDTIDDPGYLDVLKSADIISPWAVGRFDSPERARAHADTYYPSDLAWCRDQKMDYLPVVFPGFSWHHTKRQRFPLEQIPRLKGEFFRAQIIAAKKHGSDMIYIAMFDEVDEGTAIFKCTDQPPSADGVPFLTYEGLPSDFYLKLSGEAGQIIRGEICCFEGVNLCMKEQ